jgi:hypothetical protein
MSSTFEITADQDNFHIRVSKQDTDERTLAKLIEYLEFDAIRRRSQLTESQASELAADVKQAAWQQVKHLFVEK